MFEYQSLARTLGSALVASVSVISVVIVFLIDRYLDSQTTPDGRPYFWGMVAMNISLVLSVVGLLSLGDFYFEDIAIAPSGFHPVIFAANLLGTQIVLTSVTLVILSIAAVVRMSRRRSQ